MAPPAPKRIREITPFLVMDILERARQLETEGREVIHLEVGEPDFTTPRPAVEAAQRALEEGHTHYTTALGIPELREAIADHYNARYGLSLSPARVAVTTGTSAAMLMLFSILLEAGDEVILPNPHYACYPSFILSASAAPVYVPAGPREDFALRVEAVRERITEKTRALLLNSPANPTGFRLAGEEIAALSRLGVPVVSDEIYHGLSYEAPDHTVLEFDDNSFVINGFSKYFAMTGWRLGYLILPEEYVRPLEILQQNYFVSPNPFVQLGGLAALREAVPEAERMRGIYDERRKVMIRGLAEIGLPVSPEPDGAFYAFADARARGGDSLALAKEILEETGVAVAPGADFGAEGEGFLRFSYCNSIENIEKGIARIGEYLARR
ncbi:MAG: pyridoxal phosphate-dependent aminotransferase [bacterium]